jgi:hypothetical protein
MKQSWAQKELLVEETEKRQLDVNVSCPWSDGYGLLAESQDMDEYVTTPGPNYISASKPSDIDLVCLIAGLGQIQVKVTQTQTITETGLLSGDRVSTGCWREYQRVFLAERLQAVV